MGKGLVETFPEARRIFEEADRIFPDFSLSRLCFEGPEESLRLTVNAQPAIFTVSMAAFEVGKTLGVRATAAAGHSVGEYGAITAAGVLSFADALRLVRRRGELMYQSGLSRPGTMAAILGLDAATVETVCAESSNEKTVEIANLNTATQIVISGDPEAVEKAGELAKVKGAKRVIALSVSGAFHSELMEEAAAKLGEALDTVSFRDASFPVFANLTAKPVVKGDEIRALLKRQIREKVRWEETIRNMMSEGPCNFIELEPGSVLSGLVRSIDKNAKTTKFEQLLGAVRS